MVAILLFLYVTEVGQLIANTGIVARIVLVLLLSFSVLSWAIIFKKYQNFSAARRESRDSCESFAAARSSRKSVPPARA